MEDNVTLNLTTIPNPSYVYVQYNDDVNVSAFFTAYNDMSQLNLDVLNAVTLPIYYNQYGYLLNWTALGIYGIVRQDLSVGFPAPLGPVNTFTANQETPNGFKYLPNSTSYAVSDLAFQRIIQWNTFKGDGLIFTLRWLKRRCIRFLSGNIFPDNTYQISVAFTGETAVTITIYSGEIPLDLAVILQAGIEGGVLQLPFQYAFTVEISS